MQDPNCVFCRIIAGEIPAAKIAEDEYGLAFLDIAPFEKGHTLVIPKYHAALLEDLPVEWLRNFSPLMQTVGRRLRETLPCDGYNVMLNNGKSASQEVPHIHFHIVPRYEGRELEWKGGSYESDEEMLLLAKKLYLE